MPGTEVDSPAEASKPAAHRGRILIAAIAVLLAVAVGAVLSAYLGRSTKRAGVAGTFSTGAGYLTYRTTVQGPDFGKVVEVPVGGLPGAGAAAQSTAAATARAPAAAPVPAATLSSIPCERSYTASGVLLCLQSEGDVVSTPYAEVYDSSLKQVKKLAITGMPNRARLSADGRMASWTTFVSGDSYTGPAFSTRSSILDLKTGGYVENLESFSVLLHGQHYTNVDVNFWGVTFAADDQTFYATMGTAGNTFLMRGDMKARTLTDLAENVECPSLSPDGTRIVFKKRVSDDVRKPWRLEVLDLKTLAETPLAEQRSVDDQAAWLDARTVMYALPHGNDPGYDVWAVPADGSGQPRMLAGNAFSPSITTNGGMGPAASGGASSAAP